MAVALASGQRLHFASHSPEASCLLQPRHLLPFRSPGSGPRLVPSQLVQPIAQPLLNQNCRAFHSLQRPGACTRHQAGGA